MIAGAGAGLVFMVLGVFVSPWLVGLGAALVVLLPLGHAARQVRRHAVYVPEERHDPSYVEGIARWIERYSADDSSRPR
jgi:hypothetical protein